MLVLGLLGAGEAQACGGFFCNNTAPVVQAGERVVFASNAAEGTVELQVQIAYQGPRGDFAWILPVPSVPELSPGHDALFDALSGATAPQFGLQQEWHGPCWESNNNWEEDEVDSYDADTGYADAEPSVGVSVIAERSVGPYDSVVLQGTSSAALLSWLQSNGYQLPATLTSALEPYVAAGQYFVALKLSSDSSAGDIAPLKLRYAGLGMGIPIQLTAVAAARDMPLEVYVLGEARAVPANYLHVRINDAAVNWFRAGDNYRQVVSVAADEAAGQAFATDFSGRTTGLRGFLWRGRDDAVDALRGAPDPTSWVLGVQQLGLPPSGELLEVLMEVLPPPQTVLDRGVTPAQFYNCVSCYEDEIDASAFDPVFATERLEAGLIDGLREGEALVASHSHLTRMVSALDAREMTVDPYFSFNRDVPQELSNVRTARVQILCHGWNADETLSRWEAPRRLVLPDGRMVGLPSQRQAGSDPSYAMAGLAWPSALVIERLGASGQGELLFDYREEAAQRAAEQLAAAELASQPWEEGPDRPGRGVPPGWPGSGACGCATGGRASFGVAVAAALAALRRRRRA